MSREEFMEMVYEELHDDSTNERANRIIDAADEYAAEKRTDSNKKLDKMPKHEKCWHYEMGNMEQIEQGHIHFCAPDAAKTLGDRWKMKQEIDPKDCENCPRYKCRYIEYPLTINGLDIKSPEPWGIDPSLCRVRPAGDEKTYLGIYIGEIPRYTTASYNEESGTLKISTACNPMIYIPELDKSVFGDESWWSRIDSEEDLADITDEAINGQWYMKALRGLIGKEKA